MTLSSDTQGTANVVFELKQKKTSMLIGMAQIFSRGYFLSGAFRIDKKLNEDLILVSLNYDIDKNDRVQCLAWRCITKMWRSTKKNEGDRVLFTLEVKNTSS